MHPDDNQLAGKYSNIPLDAPPNSIKSREKVHEAPKAKPERPAEVEIKQIASGRVRRKSIFRRVTDNFRNTDMRGVGEDIFTSILMPGIQDLLFDMLVQGGGRVILGQDSPRITGGARRIGMGGMVQNITNAFTPYHLAGNQPTRGQIVQGPQYTNNDRVANSFRDIVLPTRVEAEIILDNLHAHIQAYDSVSVHNLLQMIGIDGSFPDMDYGWTDITGARVVRVGSRGYSLVLPNTVPLR